MVEKLINTIRTNAYGSIFKFGERTRTGTALKLSPVK